ncbi:MAG: hypothetical protein U0807_16960 [Candidatus Binatia bacterium]
MKNFWMGVLIGALAMYWFMTQGAGLQDAISDLWARASSPPEPIKATRKVW